MNGKQMRLIYVLARNAGISNDALHDIVYGITGKESISALLSPEASKVIDRLRVYAGETGDIPNRATQKQKWLIRRIEEELGWKGEPGRLRGMVQRVAGVSDVKFLTITQARKVIEALKDMQRGGRGERRLANGLDGRSADGGFTGKPT